MKKLISLVMVLSLVLCMATVAFADEAEVGTMENPIVVTDISELASVNVPSGTTKWFLVPGDWSGKVLTLSAMTSFPAVMVLHPMFGYEMIGGQGVSEASATLSGWGDILIGLTSFRGYEISGGSCTLTDPPAGSETNPEELTDITNPVVVNCLETEYGPAYFMTWTNNGEGGNLTLNGVTGNFDVVELNYTGYYSDATEPISVGVPAGETVRITVRGTDLDAITLDLSFETFVEGESGYAPFIIADQDKDYTFDAALNVNGPVYYKLTDVNSAILTINSANAVIEAFEWNCDVEEIEDNDPNVLTVMLSTWTEDDSCIIGISSNNPADTTFTVNVSEPDGYDEKPAKLDKLDSIAAEIAGGLADTYYYIWNAPSAGKVTLGITGSEWFGDALYQAATQWQEIYDDAGEWIGSDPIAWDDVNPQLVIYVNGIEVVAGTEVMFDVKADDVVIIAVKSLPIYDYETYGYSAYIDVAGAFDALGSMNNPIVVNNPSELGGIDVPAGEKVYIAISSMLNGQVLTVVGDANTAVYNRTTPITASNNLFVVALDGIPSNMIVVENKGTSDASYIAEIAYPVGSENNPIVINDPSELAGIDVPAGGKVYIAINSMLNGQVLTVVGDANTAVYNRTTSVTAENGMFNIVLDGFPTNMIVVENKGTSDASYIAGIAYPMGSENNPIILNSMNGATSASAAAGSSTYYLVNGSYNGNFIVVKGTGLTVTVNGNVVEAMGGKYYVKLDGAPVNAIIVSNNGAEAADYTISIATDNPATGDSGILVAAAVAIITLTGAVVLVANKKED